MLTVVELPGYIKDADRLIDRSEQNKIVEYLSVWPKSGVLIKGSGGVRKLRWARPGSGKRGGVRLIYFYLNESMPVFLLAMFGKNEKINLSEQERNQLRKLVSILKNTYGAKNE